MENHATRDQNKQLFLHKRRLECISKGTHEKCMRFERLFRERVSFCIDKSEHSGCGQCGMMIGQPSIMADFSLKSNAFFSIIFFFNLVINCVGSNGLNALPVALPDEPELAAEPASWVVYSALSGLVSGENGCIDVLAGTPGMPGIVASHTFQKMSVNSKPMN